MKVLITGGAGYIGSHTIIDIFDNTDFKLESIDAYFNSDANTFNRIKEISGIDVKNTNIDLSDRNLTDAFFDQNNDIDGIIHFAAFAL